MGIFQVYMKYYREMVVVYTVDGMLENLFLFD